MTTQGVRSTWMKALVTGVLATAFLVATPAKAHAQFGVAVQFDQPRYADDGRRAYWEHEQHERAEAYAREQAWERQQAYLRQQAWARQQEYLRHEAWERNEGWDRHDGWGRDRDHHDTDRDRGDAREGGR